MRSKKGDAEVRVLGARCGSLEVRCGSLEGRCGSLEGRCGSLDTFFTRVVMQRRFLNFRSIFFLDSQSSVDTRVYYATAHCFKGSL